MSTTPFWTTVFVDLPDSEYAAGVDFWRAVTGYETSEPHGDEDEFTSLLPPTGDRYLRLQRLQEGPARLHLDLHVDDVEAATDAAEALGARVAARPGVYTVLESPGGFPFCFVTFRALVRPVATDWGGHRSLVDQVCLDIPADRYPSETEFWRAVTGWELRRPSRSEFSNLVRPPGVPLRLLLQRLDEADGPVRAHLDLATDDRPAETARHERLGARVVDTFPSWTVMAGPVGLPYCITDRVPETLRLP